MNYVKLFLCVEATICIVTGIKVNMQGSLSLGKEVLDTLSYYFGNKVLSGRRSLLPTPIEDPITLAVREAILCKDLDFCQEDLQHFINEYIVILAKAVENVLSNSLDDFSADRFAELLKFNIEYVRHILKDANTKVDDNVPYYWLQSIKKIQAKFQEMLQAFITHVESPKDRIALNHKIVIATTFIERKYEIKLCSEHNICSNSYTCTKALNKILIHFKTLSEDRIRLFMKYFYESLFHSSFYNHISVTSAHEFQLILNDMVYANDTSTRDILLSVLKTVEARLEIIKTKKGLEVAHDILIAHVILSDMDHLFSNRTEPFTIFLNHFYGWLSSDVPLGKHMRAVLINISNEIWLHDEDIVSKLIRELRVFLEMTVSPEN